MSSNSIQKLREYFERFPGIGPRQAQRFVYWLLDQDQLFLKNFSDRLLELKRSTKQCDECFRFFNTNECHLCKGASRDNKHLLIVEKDADLENIEKSGFYNGRYFVLGEAVPLSGEVSETNRLKKLFSRAAAAGENGLKEITFALSANAEGDNTVRYLEKILEPLVKKYSIKISRFGRGLSTGTELEYIDAETLKNALENRK